MIMDFSGEILRGSFCLPENASRRRIGQPLKKHRIHPGPHFLTPESKKPAPAVFILHRDPCPVHGVAEPHKNPEQPQFLIFLDEG